MTGLPGRAAFMGRLQQAQSAAAIKGELLAVCHVDLDGFKRINDCHGKKVGDLLLVSVARRLQEGLRAFDLLSRVGGDEFLFILAGLREHREVEEILARVTHLIEQPHTLQGSDICVPASIGVTVFSDDCTEVETLLRHADEAMNMAKQDGCGQHLFFDRLQRARRQAWLRRQSVVLS